jgi:enoyl-CoA hydratase/carnithine racemase
MADDAAPVRTETGDGVGIVELNRPEVFNCLSTATLDGIAAALDGFEGDANVRAVLVRAAGDHFCTGADLDEVTGLLDDADALAGFIARGHAAFDRLEASPLPVVAAVHGLCLAGGLELMMACDVAFAARSARLGDQHSRFGLIPGWGGSQRLPRLIGRRRALDLMLSARWIGAEEARAWGLVNYVTDDADLAAAALAYARDLAAKSPAGLATMKDLTHRGLERSLAEGLALERGAAPKALQSPDVAEGLAAFREKRDPRFE